MFKKLRAYLRGFRAVWKLSLTTFFTSWRVFRRRLRNGPLHPGWPLRLEVLGELLRGSTNRLSAPGRTLDVGRVRAPLNRLADRAPTRGGVSLRRGGDLGGVRTEWLTPRGWTPQQPTVLYLHGGGYVLCSPGTHRQLMSKIAARSGARVAAIDYRLAPEHPFPAAVDDAHAAYKALLRDSTVHPSRLFIGGDSAGGGLTAATLLRAREDGLPQPAGGIMLSPWVDLAATGETLRTHAHLDYLPEHGIRLCAGYYAGAHDVRHPHISPLYADLRGLPPLLMHAGGVEALRWEIEAFAQRASAHGVDVTLQVYDGMFHVWHAFAPFVPGTGRAYRAIAEFIRQKAR